MVKSVFCEKVFEMNPNSIGFTDGYEVTLSDRVGLTFSFFDFAKVQLFFGLTTPYCHKRYPPPSKSIQDTNLISNENQLIL